jgi:predicted NBD/HSP70 family sugar kinase
MGEKADSELVRRQNRQIVLDLLRAQGPMARVDLGRATGLSPASITSISAQLIADNAIEELNGGSRVASHAKRGRPVVQLALKPTAIYVLAVKISAEGASLAIADFSGRQIAHRDLDIATIELDRAELGQVLLSGIETFVQDSGLQLAQIRRIGVAVQGLADTTTGEIAWSPVFRVRNIPVVRVLEDRFHIPCIISNDANMIAEGLAARDPDRYGGVTTVVFTGYGVGMALVIDGKVFHGATGAASEFGHANHLPHGALCRCGRKGCLEAYVADYGIMRLVEGREDAPVPKSVRPILLAQVLQHAADGDATARGAYAQAGEALGYGLARMIAIINPNRIIIAGPGVNGFVYMEEAMHHALDDALVDELRRQVTIERTSFDEDMILSGTITALLKAVDREIFANGHGPD